MQVKGNRSVSCHTGLNPLCLTALVRIVVTDRWACVCVWLVEEGEDEDKPLMLLPVVARDTLELDGEYDGAEAEEVG